MAMGSKFAAFGASAVNLQSAAGDRLQDAELLYVNGRFASAIAMGVYALEIHLKARICMRLNLKALPRPFEIHDLEGLLVMCGLHEARNSAPPAVQRNWIDIIDQSTLINDFRYLPAGNWDKAMAESILQQLRDPPDGVLPWLSAQP
jgi:hypothetical protein